MARKHRIAALLFSLGCLQAGSVWALGLGEMDLESFLNEPLKAKVELLNTGDLHADQIKVRLATSEDFDRLGVERAYFLTGIKFEVRVGEDGRGEIVLTSDDPVLEPYIDLIIETRWPSGRLLREYTVLVDPPAFDSNARVVSASEQVAETEATSAPSAPGKKNTEAAAASGTRVGVGEKSTLGPGEMPRRDFSEGTAQAPSPGSRYMVRRDETLWRIAEAATPAGASVHQTMLDIQRLNPNAFIDGNINKIKAGYIIYLPSAEEISSDDLEAALAEVRQQNADWRAGRESTPYSEGGPSLRISAGEDAEVKDGPGEGSGGAAGSGAARPASDGATAAALEDLDLARRENSELQQRVDSLADQVETLEDIVTVKDEQIAALQQALEEADAASGDAPLVGAAGDAGKTDAGRSVAEPGAPDAEPPAAKPATSNRPAAPEPAASKPAESGGGWMDSLLYPGIAVLLALLGGLLWWRRSQAADDEAIEDEPDVFAGVELRDRDFQVDDENDDVKDDAGDVEGRVENPVESGAGSGAGSGLEDMEPDPAAASRAAAAIGTAAEAEAETLVPEPPRADRGGYGGDHYSADYDSGDALAEADIYIAYGRYPQAIELLTNALAADPENSNYRLKLLELYAQSGRDAEAGEQLSRLRAAGDEAAVARGEAILAGLRGMGDDAAPDEVPAAAPETPAAAGDNSDDDLLSTPTVGNPAGASASPLAGTPPSELEAAPEFEESEGSLEGFDDLEIEDASFGELDSELGADIDDDIGGDLEDELDLSADFEEGPDEDDSDLVFATEGNPMSTKLDLARAYIDMGDEDGAREILEEVVNEGSGEQQQEARALLDRLG